MTLDKEECSFLPRGQKSNLPLPGDPGVTGPDPDQDHAPLAERVPKISGPDPNLSCGWSLVLGPHSNPINLINGLACGPGF